MFSITYFSRAWRRTALRFITHINCMRDGSFFFWRSPHIQELKTVTSLWINNFSFSLPFSPAFPVTQQWPFRVRRQQYWSSTSATPRWLTASLETAPIQWPSVSLSCRKLSATWKVCNSKAWPAEHLFKIRYADCTHVKCKLLIWVVLQVRWGLAATVGNRSQHRMLLCHHFLHQKSIRVSASTAPTSATPSLETTTACMLIWASRPAKTEDSQVCHMYTHMQTQETL